MTTFPNILFPPTKCSSHCKAFFWDAITLLCVVKMSPLPWRNRLSEYYFCQDVSARQCSPDRHLSIQKRSSNLEHMFFILKTQAALLWVWHLFEVLTQTYQRNWATGDIIGFSFSLQSILMFSWVSKLWI